MCFVWISEQTAIISLYNINWLVCITETECVYCAVRTETLSIIRRNLSFYNIILPHSGKYDILSISSRSHNKRYTQTSSDFNPSFNTVIYLKDEDSAGSSETQVPIYQTTRCHIPQDCRPEKPCIASLPVPYSKIQVKRNNFNTTALYVLTGVSKKIVRLINPEYIGRTPLLTTCNCLTVTRRHIFTHNAC
jgi:hypothetical protein